MSQKLYHQPPHQIQKSTDTLTRTGKSNIINYNIKYSSVSFALGIKALQNDLELKKESFILQFSDCNFNYFRKYWHVKHRLLLLSK